MEFNEKQAIYLQLAELFFEKILQKEWVEEARLPAIRELAVHCEVNPNTMLRTFNYLQDFGIIYNKRGVGYFVATGGYKNTKELKKKIFLEQELPQLKQSLLLLGMDWEELKKHLEF